jgi:hypothetical protein
LNRRLVHRNAGQEPDYVRYRKSHVLLKLVRNVAHLPPVFAVNRDTGFFDPPLLPSNEGVGGFAFLEQTGVLARRNWRC